MSETSDVKVIVVTGVESTGKTTLVNDLAALYDAPQVLETARSFIEQNNGTYTYANLEQIAINHHGAIEKSKKTAGRYVFVDTAFIVLKIWSEEKYEKCSRWILNQQAIFKPAAYILCNTDLAWEEDVLREHPLPKDRLRLHKNYVAHLQETNVPFVLVSGNRKERLEKAAQFIRRL